MDKKRKRKTPRKTIVMKDCCLVDILFVMIQVLTKSLETTRHPYSQEEVRIAKDFAEQCTKSHIIDWIQYQIDTHKPVSQKGVERGSISIFNFGIKKISIFPVHLNLTKYPKLNVTYFCLHYGDTVLEEILEFVLHQNKLREISYLQYQKLADEFLNDLDNRVLI